MNRCSEMNVEFTSPERICSDMSVLRLCRNSHSSSPWQLSVVSSTFVAFEMNDCRIRSRCSRIVFTRSNSSSFINGFSRYTSAPASTPSMRSLFSTRAETTRIGKWLIVTSALMARISCRPSMRGMAISVIIKSGSPSARISNASRPSTACVTS